MDLGQPADPAVEPVVDDAAIAEYIREHVCDVVTLHTHTGEVLYRREGASRRTGVRDDRVQGTQLLHRMHPDDLTRLVDLVASIVDVDDASATMIARVRHAEDESLWQRCPFRLFNARKLGGILALIDIGEDLGPLTLESDDPAFSLAHVAPIGLAIVGEEDDVLFVNAAMTDLTGLGAGPLAEPGADPDHDRIRAVLDEARRGRDGTETLAIGSRWVRVRVDQLREDRGEVVVSAADVTTEVEAVAAARRSEQMIRTVFEHTPAGVAILGLDGEIRDVNAAWTALAGVDRAEAVGCHVTDFVHLDDVKRTASAIRALVAGEVESVSGEMRAWSERATYSWVDARVAAVPDEHGQPSLLVSQVLDISDRKAVERHQRAREAALERSAYTDHLTGLANRRMLEKYLAMAIARAQRTGMPLAVLYCDLDRFKPVNDRYGHAAGDEVLRILARRFRDVVREGDLVSRIGGDEFVIVLEPFGSPERAEEIRDRIIAAATVPVRIGEVEVEVGISTGLAIARSGDEVADVLAAADAAAYASKRDAS